MRPEDTKGEAEKRFLEDEVLFICTGNYYRSRFAEAVFNHYAEEQGLRWRAFSRGLAIHLVPEGSSLSPQTHEHLAARKIDLRHTAPDPKQLSDDDLARSRMIIALKDDEHRPMMRKMFPEWEERVIYWNVGDQPMVSPEEGLGAIYKHVVELAEELRGGGSLQRTE
jgi:protein-tyrosine phosphatase